MVQAAFRLGGEGQPQAQEHILWLHGALATAYPSRRRRTMLWASGLDWQLFIQVSEGQRALSSWMLGHRSFQRHAFSSVIVLLAFLEVA